MRRVIVVFALALASLTSHNSFCVAVERRHISSEMSYQAQKDQPEGHTNLNSNTKVKSVDSLLERSLEDVSLHKAHFDAELT
jgi:hypothetical protein